MSSEPARKDVMSNLYHGDCLKIMPTLDAGSVDLILSDPPYGTTNCHWDSIIPLEPMWEQLKRIIKPNGAIVMTASQPFTTTLIASNMKMFRQTLTWKKNKPMNFMNANKMFMKWTEDVCVFYSSLPTYNPQKIKGRLHKNGNKQSCGNITQYSKGTQRIVTESEWYHPSSILEFPVQHSTKHPTEKPVALMEYLIRTYTNEGETVLDFAAGSFTTVIACINTNRNAIAIEKDAAYYQKGSKRVAEHKPPPPPEPILFDAKEQHEHS